MFLFFLRMLGSSAFVVAHRLCHSCTALTYKIQNTKPVLNSAAKCSHMSSRMLKQKEMQEESVQVLEQFKSHLTPHTSHLTPHTPHLTPHTSHLTPHTSDHERVLCGLRSLILHARRHPAHSCGACTSQPLTLSPLFCIKSCACRVDDRSTTEGDKKARGGGSDGVIVRMMQIGAPQPKSRNKKYRQQQCKTNI
jgi:hypothetical protein